MKLRFVRGFLAKFVRAGSIYMESAHDLGIKQMINLRVQSLQGRANLVLSHLLSCSTRYISPNMFNPLFSSQ